MLQPLSARLQGSLRLLRDPLPADPWAFLTVGLPFRAGRRAYPVPLRRHEWVRPCLCTGGDTSAFPKRLMGEPATHLLVQAFKQLRPANNYGALSAIHMCWSYHPAWHLIRLAAGRISNVPRGIIQTQWGGYVVRIAWHLLVTEDAPTPRLLLAEQQVSLTALEPLRQSTKWLSPLR